MTDDLITITQAAEELGTHARFLRKLAHQGRIPTLAMGERGDRPLVYMIREADMPQIAALLRSISRKPRKERVTG